MSNGSLNVFRSRTNDTTQKTSHYKTPESRVISTDNCIDNASLSADVLNYAYNVLRFYMYIVNADTLILNKQLVRIYVQNHLFLQTLGFIYK